MNRHSAIRSIALVALAAISAFAFAQADPRQGAANTGGGVTTQGGSTPPASGPYGLPGGAPGVQRSPLNADPGANEGAERPSPEGDMAIPQNTRGDSSGGVPMGDDAIRQECMMKANPGECRTRLRSGVPDDSVERNPP